MKEKIDLIVVPFHDYKKWIKEGFRTRDAHLFEQFKKNKNVNKILVINRPMSLLEMILKRCSWKTKVGKKIAGNKIWQLNKVTEKVFCLDIFSFSIIKVMIQRKKWWNTIFFNKKVIEIINLSLEFLNMNNRVLFLENPMAVGLVNHIGEKIFAFDSIDNWLYHPQMHKIKSIIEKNYKFIGENADIIFTVSKSLHVYFSKINKNVFWISNGVDIDRFTDSIVNDEKKRNTPSIGYMGKIQDRVDFDLIEKCLQKYSKNEFFIIGPIYSQKQRIKKIKKKYTNIKFLGDVHYNKLPLVMKKFDIAIIPHKVDDFTNSMDPLKIYEYLAAGKQIVTTKIAGADEFENYVFNAQSDKDFIDLIEKAINNYRNISNISNFIIGELKSENMWKYKAEIIINKLVEGNKGD